MNVKTRLMYNLARMYEYTHDILDICKEYNNNFELIIENKITKHAINMCLVQLGEHSARIRDTDSEFYKNNELSLPQIKGLRDRITHSYGDIDYKIIKNVLKNDIPKLEEKILELVDVEILNNPYMLYEEEYDEIFQNTFDSNLPPFEISKEDRYKPKKSTDIVKSKETDIEL